MSKRARLIAGGVAGAVVIAGGAFVLLGGRAGDLPLVGAVVDDPAICPLSGAEQSDEDILERPAVAVKIENNPVAYPLSGLEDAELVYEELVEGGLTRFVAFYHCTDTQTAGPIRSARFIDPAIVGPITKILAAAGGNDIVQKELDRAGIYVIDENTAGSAMQRLTREGISFEHTLYGKTKALRKLGTKKFDEAPPEEIFEFGDLEGTSKKAMSIDLSFAGGSQIRYAWKGGQWLRFEDDVEFLDDTGVQIGVDNVLVEEHEVNLSETVVDVLGTPSIEIADVTGSGRAMLFRDGRAIAGRWEREAETDPVRFVTKQGDVMVFAPGTIWVHLIPDQQGDVKGSFSHAKK